MHQFGDRLCLHSLHDAGPVELDRLLDHAEIGGDLLVELSRGQRSEDLALARREAGEPLADSRYRPRLARAACFSIAARIAATSTFAGTGLVRKSVAPALIARTDIGMSPWPVTNTIGSASPAVGEAALQLEAVETGHRHVEHEATLCVLRPAEKRLGRFERLDVPSLLAQPRERPQHAGSSSTRKIVRGDLRHVRCLTGTLTQNVAPPLRVVGRR